LIVWFFILFFFSSLPVLANVQIRLTCALDLTEIEYDGSRKSFKSSGLIEVEEDSLGRRITISGRFGSLSSLTFGSDSYSKNTWDESTSERFKMSLTKKMKVGAEDYIHTQRLNIDRVSGFVTGEYSLWRLGVGHNGIVFAGLCSNLSGGRKF
jgi:hypothetical protein